MAAPIQAGRVCDLRWIVFAVKRFVMFSNRLTFSIKQILQGLVIGLDLLGPQE
jgi:hypothetical protein